MAEPASIAQLPALIAAAPPRCGPVRVVAVDGGAAAGKSGLAGWLAERLTDCAVLHLDDLLDGWAGQFDYADRLHRDVLDPLSLGRPGSYHRYDWTAGRFAETVTVPVPETLIVEGVSAIAGCAQTVSVAILLDVERAERERRWVERDGPVQQSWLDWLDAEDRFFAEHPPPPGTIVLRP
jgi:uridine kinase